MEFKWRSWDTEDMCIIMKDFSTMEPKSDRENYSQKPLEVNEYGSNVASFFSIGLLFTLWP